jgi:hypothetical protein
MDDDVHESEDDALEDTRPDDIYDARRDEEVLDGDNDSPAAPASDVPGDTPLDDPAGDTDVDADELYQEGEREAIDDSDRAIGPDTEPRPLEPEE